MPPVRCVSARSAPSPARRSLSRRATNDTGAGATVRRRRRPESYVVCHVCVVRCMPRVRRTLYATCAPSASRWRCPCGAARCTPTLSLLPRCQHGNHLVIHVNPQEQEPAEQNKARAHGAHACCTQPRACMRPRARTLGTPCVEYSWSALNTARAAANGRGGAPWRLHPTLSTHEYPTDASIRVLSSSPPTSST